MPLVLGYGSLVNRESVSGTLGRRLSPGEGPHPARLLGARRAWNVGSPSTEHPQYAFRTPDGRPWRGFLTFLGLEEAPDESTLGAVVEVTSAELVALDQRERGYLRVDVTDRLQALDGWEPPGPVETYWPRPEVVDATRRSDRSIMTRYLDLVDAGYRALGEDRYAEHLATLPGTASCRVEEILVEPVTARG